MCTAVIVTAQQLQEQQQQQQALPPRVPSQPTPTVKVAQPIPPPPPPLAPTPTKRQRVEAVSSNVWGKAGSAEWSSPQPSPSSAPSSSSKPSPPWWGEETHQEGGRGTERWRPREGNPEGGRFGDRGDHKAWWFALRKAAQNRGPAAVTAFYAKYGKRISHAKAKAKLN